MEKNTERIIEINCLKHIYPDKTKMEICGIELTVSRGERVAILGPSGSGKTTLLKHIIGLLTPTNGTVRVFGVDPTNEYHKVRKKVGVILQTVEEQLIGPTVLEDVMFSPVNYGIHKDEALVMAEKVLEELGIMHLRNKIIHYLSGGEKRKVALAGALVMEPELLVLDEPFAGLDLKSEKAYVKLINEYSKDKQISVIISMHNVELVSEIADTVYLISSGDHLSMKGTPHELLSNPEILEVFNLETPVLSKLFNKLKQEGLEVEVPLNPEQAADILLTLIKKHCP